MVHFAQHHGGMYLASLQLRKLVKCLAAIIILDAQHGKCHQDLSVRIRYRQPLQEATLIMRESGLYILFDEPQRGITRGQFAAWYTPVEASLATGAHDTSMEMIGSGVI